MPPTTAAVSALRPQQRAHREADDAVVGRDHEARDAGQHAAEDAGAARSGRYRRPTRAAASGIVGAGAIGAAEGRATQHHDATAATIAASARPASTSCPRLTMMAARPRRAAVKKGCSQRWREPVSSRRASPSAIARPIVAISSACELRRCSGANTSAVQHRAQGPAGRGREPEARTRWRPRGGAPCAAEQRSRPGPRRRRRW